MSGTTENITVIGKRKRDRNELRIVVKGMSYSGWTSVKVTRGVERMPADFDVTVTEKYPGIANQIPINPGDPCVVYVGDDRIITGYVDRYVVSISPGAHEVRVTGRGKCQDLVDCSAGVIAPATSIGGQYAQTTVPALFTAIAYPFGITVTDATAGLLNTYQVPQFSINFGETPFEIIDRVARYAGCLAYEDQHGNLVISLVGTTSAASGFVQAVNIQRISSARSLDERFSVYLGSLMSMDSFSQFRNEATGYAFDGMYKDDGVPRFRPRVIVSEQVQNNKDVCQTRAIWEGKRRYGRSQAVNLVCDSWRDSAGKLWTPNTLAPISMPAAKCTPKSPWIIGEVTYSRGEDGTTAMLTLMPPEAYSPEPSVLKGVDPQVYYALHPPGGAAKP